MNHTTEPRTESWRFAAKRLHHTVCEPTPSPAGHFTEWPCEDGDTVLTWTPDTPTPTRGGYDWTGAGVA